MGIFALLADGADELVETVENATRAIEDVSSLGNVIAIIGVALCVILCGVASALGLFKTGSCAAGVLGENPKKFGKVMVLVLLPATQGIYGFIIGIIAVNTAITATMTVAQGWLMFAAVMPMALTGLVTGIFQGRSASNCIKAVAKQDSLGGRLILYPAMIEFYAILGLIISIIAVSAVV